MLKGGQALLYTGLKPFLVIHTMTCILIVASAVKVENFVFNIQNKYFFSKSRLYETVKAVDTFDLRFWDLAHLKEKKCCVSRAYVCWVTPNFWKNALIPEKRSETEAGLSLENPWRDLRLKAPIFFAQKSF